MPSFSYITEAKVGNIEINQNSSSAPIWSISSTSGDFPTGNSWAISSANLRICFRNAYGNPYRSFFVIKNGAYDTGTVLTELTPQGAGGSGVWNTLNFPSSDIADSKKNNFLGMTRLCLQGNGAVAAQVLTNTAITLTVNWTATTTSCAAPASASAASPATSASTTVEWSGAAGGTNNAITGYQIQKRDSADQGETYGEWTDLKTVSTTATSGSTTVDMPTVLGTYREFRIRTLGNAGSVYYSDWKTFGPSVRTALATAPNSVLVSNATPYPEEAITVTWTGAVAGVNDTISGYAIWRSDTEDGEYEQIGTVVTNISSGSFATVGSDVFGGTYYFKVQTLSGTNTAYNSDLSVAFASATSGYGTPDAPSTITAVPTQATPGSVILLKWSAVADAYLNPVTGYQVGRSSSESGPYYNVVSTTETETQVHVPTTAGDRYYFKVLTLGTINGYNSEYSTATAAVAAVNPPAVTGGIGRTNAET